MAQHFHQNVKIMQEIDSSLYDEIAENAIELEISFICANTRNIFIYFKQMSNDRKTNVEPSGNKMSST